MQYLLSVLVSPRQSCLSLQQYTSTSHLSHPQGWVHNPTQLQCLSISHTQIHSKGLHGMAMNQLSYITNDASMVIGQTEVYAHLVMVSPVACQKCMQNWWTITTTASKLTNTTQLHHHARTNYCNHAWHQSWHVAIRCSKQRT